MPDMFNIEEAAYARARRTNKRRARVLEFRREETSDMRFQHLSRVSDDEKRLLYKYHRSYYRLHFPYAWPKRLEDWMSYENVTDWSFVPKRELLLRVEVEV